MGESCESLGRASLRTSGCKDSFAFGLHWQESQLAEATDKHWDLAPHHFLESFKGNFTQPQFLRTSAICAFESELLEEPRTHLDGTAEVEPANEGLTLC